MKKVLVIEDSPTFSELVAYSIKAIFDFHIEKAATLAEAKSILAEQGDSFFCATIDINLPDAMPGAAVELVTEEYPHIAPIVMTGELSTELREAMLSLQVADYVWKKGQYNLDYVAHLVFRLYKNPGIEVLVVDDSKTERCEMKHLLAVQHYKVIEASSGNEALELLRVHKAIKLVIIDCNMEGLSGIELSTIIREHYAKDEMAIIGVSSSGSKNMSATFIKSGANDFLSRPFLPEEFFCRVNQNIDYIDSMAAQKEANDVKNLALGTAAHDIRGPIGVIQGLAEMLKRADNNKAKRDKYINTIIDTSTELLELLNSLLNLTELEDGNVAVSLEEVDLCELVKRRVEFYHYISDKKKIKITPELQPLDSITCDPTRIKQVVDNLISNAIKYSPIDSTVQVKLFEESGWQHLEVVDQGCGIDDSNVNKLFCAYQRLGNKTTAGEGSAGLGLAICKNFIEAHDGRIGYRHGETGGSCFYFMLPKK